MLSESTPNSEEREALIEKLLETRCIATPRLERGFAKPVPEEAALMADAVLAAGYRKPSLVDGDTAELIADARKWPSDMGEGALMNALADLVESLSTQRQAIPRYSMLDVWMALYGSDRSQEFEPFYDEHGYAETWAQLCAEVRAAGYRPQDEVKAQALEEFANLLYERYPADVFVPPSNDDMQSFRDAAKATGRTLDRFSAEIFRRAAAQAVAEAAEIREESSHE